MALTYHARVGLTAGTIWRHLERYGDTSLSQLKTQIKSEENTPDLILQGLGWLAREEKIEYIDKPRGVVIRLR